MSEDPLSSLTIDFNKRSLNLLGEEQRFSPTEFSLFLSLLNNVGGVCSDQDLKKNLLEQAISNSENIAVKMHVSNINRKLKALCAEVEGYEISIFKQEGEGYSLLVRDKIMSHKNQQRKFLLEGQALYLPSAPYKVLSTLCENFGSVVKREDLGDVSGRSGRSKVDMTISKTRGVLSVSADLFQIEGIPNEGYELMWSPKALEKNPEREKPDYDVNPHIGFLKNVADRHRGQSPLFP